MDSSLTQLYISQMNDVITCKMREIMDDIASKNRDFIKSMAILKELPMFKQMQDEINMLKEQVNNLGGTLTRPTSPKGIRMEISEMKKEVGLDIPTKEDIEKVLQKEMKPAFTLLQQKLLQPLKMTLSDTEKQAIANWKEYHKEVSDMDINKDDILILSN